MRKQQQQHKGCGFVTEVLTDSGATARGQTPRPHVSGGGTAAVSLGPEIRRLILIFFVFLFSVGGGRRGRYSGFLPMAEVRKDYQGVGSGSVVSVP